MMYWILSTAIAQTHHWSTLPVCIDNISVCEAIYTAEPLPTRNPALFRFNDPTLADSQWTPLHVQRLVAEETPEHVQLALITLISQQSLLSFGSELLPVYSHPSAELRAAMVDLIPQLELEEQTIAIERLRTDSDWLVREQTMRMIARHLGPSYSSVLHDGLDDTSPEVRIQAVKGLGWNNIETPLVRLEPLLKDSDSTVRLNALRTIERLHPSSVLKLDMVDSLLADSDPKVRREILRIQKTH